MFSVECVNLIREHELRVIEARFRPDARILELGGGNGVQAKLMTDHGFDIVSIDVPQTTGYLSERNFPIIEFDGKRIPFKDASFDIVFSSNVLEHILDLDDMQQEIKRVMREDAYCVHAMPSATWRFWTAVTSYLEMCERILGVLPAVIPRGVSRGHAGRVLRSLRDIAGLLLAYRVPPRHGEVGNVFTELFTFSRRAWKRRFTEQGFVIETVVPMGLFYTGHTILALKLSVNARQWLAKILGSSCVLYVVRPENRVRP